MPFLGGKLCFSIKNKEGKETNKKTKKQKKTNKKINKEGLGPSEVALRDTSPAFQPSKKT